MGVLLLFPGIFFALLFVVNVVFQTRAGNTRIGRWGALLAFLTGVFLLAALITNNRSEIQLSIVAPLTRLVAAVIVISCVAVAYSEYRRPNYRLAESRGLLGIGVGLFVIFMSFTVSAFFPAPPQEVAEDESAEAVPAPTSTPANEEERSQMIIDEVLAVITDETGLDRDEILTQFDNGVAVAQMVETSGGDIGALVQSLVVIGNNQIQYALSRDRIGQIEAGLALSFMEPGVWAFVNGQLGSIENIARVFSGRPIDLNGADDLATSTPPPNVTPTH